MAATKKSSTDNFGAVFVDVQRALNRWRRLRAEEPQNGAPVDALDVACAAVDLFRFGAHEELAALAAGASRRASKAARSRNVTGRSAAQLRANVAHLMKTGKRDDPASRAAIVDAVAVWASRAHDYRWVASAEAKTDDADSRCLEQWSSGHDAVVEAVLVALGADRDLARKTGARRAKNQS